MREILDEIETPYVDCQTLLAHLSEYRNPRDWIARMVKKGELIRLRNGFFLIASRFRRSEEYPCEQIANLLYGPSYVSLEWALSFYGFIPERVSVVTSVTTGSSKEFDTPIGTFSFRRLRKARYAVGIDRGEIAGQLGGFLIACPEKALVDWVFFSTQPMSKEELAGDLLDGKRLDPSKLKSLDHKMLEEICKKYKNINIQNLLSIVREL